MTEKKGTILNLINKKTANFLLEKKISDVPGPIKKYNPELNNDRLSIQYDKSETNINKIINDLKDSNILFKEINTFEPDLEDVFIQLTRKNK